jgi:argininosuccinate synthase
MKISIMAAWRQHQHQRHQWQQWHQHHGVSVAANVASAYGNNNIKSENEKYEISGGVSAGS